MDQILTESVSLHTDAERFDASLLNPRRFSIQDSEQYERKTRSPELIQRKKTQRDRDDEKAVTQHVSSGIEESLENSGKILVYCRMRPLNRYEIKRGNKICVTSSPDQKSVIVKAERSLASQATGEKKNDFRFNQVFNEKSTQ